MRAAASLRPATKAIIAMSAALAFTAPGAFAAGTLSVDIDGVGRVDGDGIDCTRGPGDPAPQGACSAYFEDAETCSPHDPDCFPVPAYTVVTAAAIPGSGFSFDHWDAFGCWIIQPQCGVTMSHDESARAVFRDTEAPTVGLTQTVSGTMRLRAAGTDNVGVARVEFRVRGVLRRTDTQAPYTWSLDTTKIADGPAQITATSFDAAGNSRATSMDVVVDN